MAENPATESDLANRSLRTLTPQELQVGGVLLDDAWNIINSRNTTVGARLDALPANLVFSALIVQIECAMVLRVLNNPDGVLEEAGDDYRFRRDAALSTGSLYLSDAELALIGAGDSTSDGAFTIKTTAAGRGRGYWSDTTTWVPLP